MAHMAPPGTHRRSSPLEQYRFGSRAPLGTSAFLALLVRNVCVTKAAPLSWASLTEVRPGATLDEPPVTLLGWSGLPLLAPSTPSPTLPPVPDDPRPRSPGSQEAPAGRPCADALADFRGRLRAAGPVSEWDEGDHPWRILRDLARDGRYLGPHDVAAWLNARGGSEHLCRHLPDVERWEKVTLANSAGWWVDLESKRCLPATPLQYFERMAAVNEVFGDDTRLVGIDTGPGPHDTRIRTTQPQIVGESPSLERLVEWMEQAGFEREPDLTIGAYDALTFRREQVWVFDVRPMNFVEREGELFPIDVIVVLEPLVREAP